MAQKRNLPSGPVSGKGRPGIPGSPPSYQTNIQGNECTHEFLNCESPVPSSSLQARASPPEIDSVSFLHQVADTGSITGIPSSLNSRPGASSLMISAGGGPYC